ncbi:hypothetical protein Sfulv_09080 [Streptomyces fulvorobeus]|uniref:Uncharacterized protein n=1 Tax=Streptomyces fulvorobeus TaxID=284028 RepID=A0A7J0C239_9ACTN|nr:hypothetical protein Sfulv_09080 [Streptomyces fulvorobeus]
MSFGQWGAVHGSLLEEGEAARFRMADGPARAVRAEAADQAGKPADGLTARVPTVRRRAGSGATCGACLSG